MRRILTILSLCWLQILAVDDDKLKEVFHWKQLDFAYPTDEDRQTAMVSGEFVPENNLPLGLEVYKDRVFITVPRWKTGVPASLTYIMRTDPKDSPRLHPYPNWEAHNMKNNNIPDIVSPFRTRADRCGRLWVLDTGLADILGEGVNITTTRLLIYDLSNDQLLRTYSLPPSQIKEDSFFANIAVEDQDCEDTYAYLGDLGKPGLVVYSWKKKSSWRVHHNFFHIDPLAGEFNVDNVSFVWTDGVFGLALSQNDSFGYSTLYFHPLTGTNEFAVNTSVLRNESLAGSKMIYHEFKNLGSRGLKGQSSVSFLDKKTGVLFYALLNLNCIACWRTTNPSYTMESQGRVYMNNVTMVFPNDIKVDSNDNLWVLSDRLSRFMYLGLNETEINFRILMAPVREAIKGTACDPKFKPNPNVMEKFKPSLDIKKTNSTSSGSPLVNTISWITAVLIAIYSL